MDLPDTGVRTISITGVPEGRGFEYLSGVSQELSHARTLGDVTRVTRQAARALSGADGATFILREGDLCYYLDEDAIAPLWKGRKFPLERCVSGWSMLNRSAVVIQDIYEDERVPHEAYRPTFVKSLAMVPIREDEPLGAIGNYWSTHHRASDETMLLLRSLANLTAIALQNVRLIEELGAANQALMSSIQARDEFLSVASHELRTPLSSLKLQIQLLERRLQESGDEELAGQRFRAGFDLSLRQIDSLGRLIENLLDVSRIQMKRLELNQSCFDLSEAVAEMLGRHEAQLEAAKCRLTVRLQENLRGEWDRSRVEQILTNLISNACKYAAGSTVTVQTVRQHGTALLIVEDTGPGIQAENHDRIFERFERAHSPVHISGLGLGLFITNSLVEAHRGKIFLDSAIGKGAKFTVVLPGLTSV